ncbi:MAG: GGDEF domain-containing phosphodiesterase, partial [Gammaproteobacteria bacterium]|nr:GGDEF domain-containing phosphodiesterase [Gammaproteobacteria bacterium]
INAGLGHEAGDRILQQAGEKLRSIIAGQGQIGHLGAGHFIIYQTENEISLTSFTELASSISTHFEAPFMQGTQRLTCTASVVYAWFGRDDVVPYSLLHALEKQCKKIKTRGGNDSAQLTAVSDHEVEKHLLLEEALRADLNGPSEGLRLIYAPYVNLTTNQIYGFEALMRWRHPDKGLVETKDVISIAEQSQLILTLGDRVIRGAASHLAGWRNEKCEARVSINLSLRQMSSGHISAGSFLSTLAEYGLIASDVDIEVAESTLSGNLEHVGLQLRALADAGVRVWLDDFDGSSQALQYFSYLPIYGLKVDVRGFDPSSGDTKRAVKFASVISAAHDHAFVVVAEGVETETQLEFLRAERCDYAQGWFFTKGLTAGEVVKYVNHFSADK